MDLFKIVLTALILIEVFADQEPYNPKNLCVRLVTNNTALIQWIEPVTVRAEIISYTVYYTKYPEIPLIYWNSQTIGNTPMTKIRVDTGQIYTFRIRLNSLGLDELGPLSDPYNYKMINRTRSCYDHPETSTIISLNVLRASATSYNSVEVWWNFPYDPHYVTGFQVFYGFNDTVKWHNKSVGLVQSTELENLVQSATYKISLAAVTTSGLEFYPQETSVLVQPEEVPMDVKVYDVTEKSVSVVWSSPVNLKPIRYKITYDGFKEFVDDVGITQRYSLEKIEFYVGTFPRGYTINQLIPDTTYSLNISAVPVDYSYRPSVKIQVRTEMAAPPPMVRPDLYGIVDDEKVQMILPKASEEYGPISFYYVIVVPENGDGLHVPSSVYSTEELVQSEGGDEEIGAPYIAARFSQKLPYAFMLGSGENSGLFKNQDRKLQKNVTYKMFVRAVVVTNLDDLFTDSPYSKSFSIEKSKKDLSYN